MRLMATTRTLAPAQPRARLAAAAAFVTQGFVFISLTTRLPPFTTTGTSSEVDLSLLLLMIVLLAGVGLGARRAACKRVRQRHHAARRPARRSRSPSRSSPWHRTAAVFVASLAVYGVGLGIVDATSNMQAVALEHRYGRPILPSFHGAWTFGGILGAALRAGDAATCRSPRPGLVAVVPLAAVAAPYLRASTARPSADAAQVDVPWRPILLVGPGDGALLHGRHRGVQTWGPTFLDHVVDAPPAGGAGDAALPGGQPAPCAWPATALVARYGAVPVLRTGAVVASPACSSSSFAPTWPVAVLGFTLLGAGVAVIAPLSFSAAARIAGRRADPCCAMPASTR